MPTIREAITNALEALKHGGFPPGGDVYDDLWAVLRTLEVAEPDMLDCCGSKILTDLRRKK